jgi:hypothetical protein
MEGAKELIQSVMESIRQQREAASQGPTPTALDPALE